MDGSGRGRGQAGVTLLEVLIAMVIIAIVVVGLISGLFTMIRASDVNEDLQRVEAALVSFGNSVKEMPYAECGGDPPVVTASVYKGEYDAWGEKWEPAASSGLVLADLKVLTVEHWNPSPDGGNPPGWYTTCASPDYGVQRITLQVSYQDESGTAQIIKRRPAERENP